MNNLIVHDKLEQVNTWMTWNKANGLIKDGMVDITKPDDSGFVPTERQVMDWLRQAKDSKAKKIRTWEEQRAREAERVQQKEALERQIQREERERERRSIEAAIVPELVIKRAELESRISKAENDNYFTGMGEAVEALRFQLETLNQQIDREMQRSERRSKGIVSGLKSRLSKPSKPLPNMPINLYPGMVNVLYGDSFSGKSYLALHLAQLHSTNGGEVVYFQNESSPEIMALRQAAWFQEYGGDSDIVLIDAQDDGVDLRLTDEQSADEFLEFLQERDLHPSMLIIDSVSGAIQGQENDNNAMRKAFDSASYLAKQLGAAIILIDHTGKNSSAGMRGAKAKYDRSDTVYEVSKVKGGVMQVECTKDKVNGDSAIIGFSWNKYEIELDGEKFTQQVPILKPGYKVTWATRVLKFLQDNPNRTFTEIEQELGVPKGRLSEALKSLQSDAEIVQDDDKYAPA